MAKMTSRPSPGIESMIVAGKARRETTNTLPPGYASGGVPGGRGGGMGVGPSGHAQLRKLGASSPASMSPGMPGKKSGW
jgi:hypothetical protein